MNGPLETLLEIARRRCDEAARAVAQELAGQRALEQKAKVLEQYRAEYLLRQSAGGARDTDVATLRNFAGFLDKLDDAVGHAAREKADSQARVARAQAAWNDAKRTLEGYLALERREAARAGLRERRAEQRQQDEFAARSTRPQGDLPS